jgi:hypothetical protein
MTFDAQAIFANLAEQERIKGHHSPEGRAIRTLSRALNGWSCGDLSARDVIVLCAQAVEDWLIARLERSPWSAQSVSALMVDAIKKNFITRVDAVRLEKMRNIRARSDDEQPIAKNEVESALEFCIQLIEKHW